MTIGQPEDKDAVLGGQGALPIHSVVLGGWDGLRRRCASPLAEQRAASLQDALQYGTRGLDLVVKALADKSEQVRHTAYTLLEHRTEPHVKEAIARFYTYTHYAQLRRSLVTGNWQEADQLTKLALLNACGSGLRDHLPTDLIVDLPCRDLLAIDQLWVRYSRGRFGFSVQHSIWRKFDDLYWEKSDVWLAFGDRVGWRINNLLIHNHWKRYGEITFSQDAPVGHLPFMGDGFGIFTVGAVAKRLSTCKS